MHCLTKEEESVWLGQNNLPLEPYGKSAEDLKHHVEFYPPKIFRGVEAFVWSLITQIAKPSSNMVTIVDTEIPADYEITLIKRLRSGFGEIRPLMESPAHLFFTDESQDVITLFSLTVALGWEAYLYMPSIKAVLLNWEGEIFDFWTSDTVIKLGVIDLIKTFGLEEVKRKHA